MVYLAAARRRTPSWSELETLLSHAFFALWQMRGSGLERIRPH